MPRPISPKTLEALRLMAQGVNPYRAALTAGIKPSSAYRWRARILNPKPPIKASSNDAKP